jgi:hypothetical protein
MPLRNVATLTYVRLAVLGLVSVVALLFPGLIPEGAEETIADHAVNIIGAITTAWFGVLAWQARRKTQGKEVL